MQTLQRSLFSADNGKEITLVDVPIDKCEHSRFNTRKTRDDEQIKRLAERIDRIGFERTRALWAYNGGDKYKVFAGGTRLEAARLAGLETVPVMVHAGYDDKEISRRADLDNENDEYHNEVPITDVWAEYARLSEEEGWSVQEIMEAKGVGKTMVYDRLELADAPPEFKGFFHRGGNSERSARKIKSVKPPVELSRWITIGSAWINLAQQTDGKSEKTVTKTVKDWQTFIEYAESVFDELGTVTLHRIHDNTATEYEYDAAQAFVDELTDREARSLAEVKAAEHKIRNHIDSNLRQYRTFVETQSEKAAREAEKSRREQELIARSHNGNCLEWIPTLDNNIKLLLTDPPYGKDFQSNRRVVSPKAPKLEGDASPKQAAQLLADMLQRVQPKLAEDAHLLIFTSFENECLFKKTIIQAGFTIKGGLVWIKENHSSGDLQGSFAPRHERILHAVQGNPKVSPRIDDVLEVPRTYHSGHPTEKPTDLLASLIEATTEAGDLVIDPFAGTAATALAAMQLDRDFAICELSEQWWREGINRILQEANLE